MAEQDQQGGPEDGIGAAAQQAYTEALEGGASPGDAFGSAMQAAEEASPPDTQMEPPPPPPALVIKQSS